MVGLAWPLPPHPRLKLFLSPLSAAPTRPLHSPEEIKVDGGELVLDEGPERPEEVRCLETDQSESAGQSPTAVPDPGQLDESHCRGHGCRPLAEPRGGLPSTSRGEILEVKSRDSIWGLRTFGEKAESVLLPQEGLGRVVLQSPPLVPEPKQNAIPGFSPTWGSLLGVFEAKESRMQ